MANQYSVPDCSRRLYLVYHQYKYIAKMSHTYAPAPRSKRSQSLKKLIESRPILEPLSPRRQQPLQRVIDEVLKHLIDIIETLLLQENSNNYINFMKKSQQMNQQLQRKLSLMIDQKIDQLRQELMLKESVPTKIKKVDNHSLLKKERKQLAHSIINYQRSNSFNLTSQRSADFLKNPINNDIIFPQIEQEAPDDKTIANSIDFHSISARISEFQQNHSKNLKDLYQSLQKKIEQSQRDIEGLTQKHIDFKLKFQEKLEANLQALWNVVTDVKSQMVSKG